MALFQASPLCAGAGLHEGHEDAAFVSAHEGDVGQEAVALEGDVLDGPHCAADLCEGGDRGTERSRRMPNTKTSRWFSKHTCV